MLNGRLAADLLRISLKNNVDFFHLDQNQIRPSHKYDNLYRAFYLWGFVMLRTSAFIFLTLILTGASFADENWITVAASGDEENVFRAKKGTLTAEETKGGETVITVIGQSKYSSDIVKIEKWYVSAQDCINEYGTLVTLDMNGDFLHENDFAFGGDSVASGIGQFICEAAIEVARQTEEKGI